MMAGVNAIAPVRSQFAAATAQSERRVVRQSLVCAMIVYLRTGPGEYGAYNLEGGP